MLAKRIIPCLDVKNGRTVKGINFNNLLDMGDPVDLALEYCMQGADELVLLDITATLEGRSTFLQVVKNVAKAINIPFTVGGGISTVDEVEELLLCGADKVSLNTSVILNPILVTEVANQFGSQCAVVAIDTRLTARGWEVVSHSGTRFAGKMALSWAKECENLGAGEILLTSFTSDGTCKGFALDITACISNALKIPVIASGGAGTSQHFVDVFKIANANAALAAGVFHCGEIVIGELKELLTLNNIPVRRINSVTQCC